MAATQLSGDELQRLARVGAATRLEQIEVERQNILRAFPELARGRAATPGRTPAAAAPAASAKRTRRRNMSAEARRAVSERMTKYWAERRKAKKGGK